MASAGADITFQRQVEASQQHEPLRLSPEEYTVGWICAIPCELRAARAMLDEKHAPLRSKPKHDENSYLLGRIGEHYITIACLPEYGNNRAAIAAKSMQSTFPNLRFGVLVGIGGGVPSGENDIRLGDVVVSLPTEQGGGVIQYDLGRREINGFRRVGSLNKPPTLLRTAIVALRASDKVGREISSRVNEAFQGMEEPGEEWTYPSTTKDILYREDNKDHVKNISLAVFLAAFFPLVYYLTICFLPMQRRSATHSGIQSLQNLLSSVLTSVFVSALITGMGYYTTLTIAESAAKEIVREPRPNTNPKIHYGNIASGNSVMKNGFERDFLAKRDSVICFEMEAAGLMDDFPCLVIRGISDYADSRKNWQWQPYAAATAAAYARSLLFEVTPESVKDLKPIGKILENLSENVDNLTRRRHEQEHQDITDWLTPVDYAHRQSDFLARREEGTGEWLLESTEFQQWLEQSSNHTLFCPGMPGAGKTIIASIVIHHLHNIFRNEPTIGIAYLYCNFRQQHEQKSADLVLNLLKQLVQQQPLIPKSVENLYSYHKLKRSRPSPTEISQALRSVLKSFSRTFIIVDALDECQVSNEGRKMFLSQIFDLQDQTKLSIFVTSRFIPDIKEEFERREETISLEIRASDADVRKYLDAHISRLPLFVRERPDLTGQVKTVIIEGAKGMFLLATLYLNSLEDKINVGQVKHALEMLPKGSDAYNTAYTEAMERIQGQRKGHRDLAIQALSWITCTERHLTTTELRHALAIQDNIPELDKDNITEIQLMVSVCAGLVIVDEESNIIRLVHHTTHEYFKWTWGTWFPDAQADITRRCVTYLLFDAFKTGFCETDEELEGRLQLNVLYDYASRNWGHHARKCLNKKIELLILDLLESRNKVFACSQAMLASGNYLGYSQNAPREMTGLHLAAYFGLRESVAILLEKHPNLDAKDDSGRTALHWAAVSGCEAVVDLLLEKRADLDSQDKDDRTALHWAAESGHKTVVELLLKNGAQKESYDRDNRTPLQWAAEKGREAVVNMLLEKGANLHSKDKGSRTALHWAAGSGYEAVVRLLLEKEANLETEDEYNRTPLHWASENGHETVVELLLENGASLESEDKSKWTPLHWAAESGHKTVVELLLKNGAQKESQDKDNRTPLHWAAEKGREAVVNLLLEKGANRNHKDKDERTPIDWAKESRRQAVVELLRERVLES